MSAVERHSGFEIRSATGDDLERVFGILRFNDLPVSGVPAGLENFFVCEEEGEVVGVAGIEVFGDDGLLRSVAVLPKTHGQGLGSRLTAHALDLGRRIGLEHLYLLTTTAEQFFAKFGFVVISRSEVPLAVRQSVEFTTACPETATVMARALSPDGSSAVSQRTNWSR